MAGKELDALARGLADERISRGKALKRMGVALLGGVLAAAPMGAAFASPRPRADEDTNNPNDFDCPGNHTLCEARGRNKSVTCCGPNQTCQNGTCV